jgi:hypothetical protein
VKRVREREDTIRTRLAGSRDEVEGVVPNTLELQRNGTSLLANAFGVGFIDWSDLLRLPEGDLAAYVENEFSAFGLHR